MKVPPSNQDEHIADLRAYFKAYFEPLNQDVLQGITSEISLWHIFKKGALLQLQLKDFKIFS